MGSLCEVPPSSPSPLMLWCHPRSLSTAFERAFLQRPDDFVCLHEPFGDPFYFGEEALSTRFKAQCSPSTTSYSSYIQVLHQQILRCCAHPSNSASSPRRVFAKDMAQYIVLPAGHPPIEEDNPTIIPKHLLSKLKHTFLLRDPHKSIPSYWRMCIGDASRETGFLFYDPNEAGYSELRTLFDYVHNLTGVTPLLITAEDLLHDPLHIMQLYSRHVGVVFQPSMLNWEAKRIPAFDKWKGFHE